MTDRAGERFQVLGVDVLDRSMEEAVALLEQCIREPEAEARAVYFVNAHTLNVAHANSEYRAVLRAGDLVFGDGTGVRWAARYLHGRRLRGNVNGTDLVPALFAGLAGRGYRYFLLGATPDAIERSAEHARRAFPGWTLAGYHHGYVDIDSCAEVLETIETAQPHLLLVGMGNPKQERWIHHNRSRLKVPLCLGIGGLLDYWAGDLDRAPGWIRRLGFEWLHLLRRQPRKFRRYVIGNPQFLLRVARSKWGRGPVALSRGEAG
ncbi:MAG: WecB/TagA/CpsF family glycosyltransferase [Proteobacteria bacterium]|nr:WecB/TagA/CpsF family glycosyltransferase [Pseudomonadota bacterium]